LQASFPHDVEIISSKNQPPCASHTFVIQQDSTQTLYGVCLRVWSRADDKRKETITELRKRSEPGFHSMDTEEYWIPYAYILTSFHFIDGQSVLPLPLSSLQPFVRLSQGHVDRIYPAKVTNSHVTIALEQIHQSLPCRGSLSDSGVPCASP
jgi:uDENN domain